jgi:superfamily II RNA helicase
LQREFEVDISIEFSPTFAALTEIWANGATWEEMRQFTTYDEGDMVRSLRRTVDLCRQMMRAPGMPEALIERCKEVELLIARDEVKEDF